MTRHTNMALLWALAVGLLAVNPPSHAESGEPSITPAVSIKGFGTLGIARSDTDDAQYVRDLSQPDGLTKDWSGKIDSLLGLQANIKFSEQTEAVLQAVSRYRYDGTYTPELTWAFLRHDLSPEVSLRAGRLGTEFYMLADSRMVGYANLTVRPPPDYYGTLIFTYFDGVDVGATTAIGNGLVRGKLFLGRSPEDSAFAGSLSWDLDGSLIVGGHLDYFTGPWQVRLGHSQVRFENEIPLNKVTVPTLGPTYASVFLANVPELSAKDTRSRFTSLGVVYDDGPLQLQGMFSHTTHESASFEDANAGYVVAAYRLGGFTPYLGYSQVKSKAKSLASPPPYPFDAVAARVMSTGHSDQHTLFLGTRWDLRQNMALKAQVDWIRGSSSSVFPYRQETPEWDGDMTVFSLALDFVF